MSDPLFSVEEQLIVITGGLGQLGRHFATELAARGARIGLLDIQDDPDLLPEPLGAARDAGRLLLLHGDVTSRDSLVAALTQLDATWGPPHGLVNSAAMHVPPNAPATDTGPFETYPEEAWDRMMDVNLKGVFLACQVFGGAMAQAGRGSVINISSTYGLVSPDQRIYQHIRDAGTEFYKPVSYSAAKSALFNVTRYLATYWAEKGVRVNTLSFSGVFANQDDQFIEAFERRLPLGRMAHPEDYTGAVIFLLSQASAYMTGSSMVVDGGWTAW